MPRFETVLFWCSEQLHLTDSHMKLVKLHILFANFSLWIFPPSLPPVWSPVSVTKILIPFANIASHWLLLPDICQTNKKQKSDWLPASMCCFLKSLVTETGLLFFIQWIRSLCQIFCQTINYQFWLDGFKRWGCVVCHIETLKFENENLKR